MRNYIEHDLEEDKGIDEALLQMEQQFLHRKPLSDTDIKGAAAAGKRLDKHIKDTNNKVSLLNQSMKIPVNSYESVY